MDADGDSFGTSGIVAYSCQQPSGYVADTSDCDDSDALINPNGVEICNGLDDDCDGTADIGHLGLDELSVVMILVWIFCKVIRVQEMESITLTFQAVLNFAECDMGSFGGGWTQVFMDNMSPPILGGRCSKPTIAVFGVRILGGYGIISSGSINNSISTRSVPHSKFGSSLIISL